MSIDETPEFQKILCAERGSPGRDERESILWQQVRHVTLKGLQIAGLVVVKDSILTPGDFPRYQLVLGAMQRMKGVGYTEPVRGGSHTTCT